MKIRKHLKKLSILALLIFVNQIAFPTYVLALTAGPTQPEVHGFEPIGTNQMVDLFSGDFTYNIPLFDIGGYPINIAYHSGVGTEQEASWVGLGWSLTPGSISRSLRGLPDDFNGEEVKFMRKMKANQTIGLDVGLAPEAFGFEVMDGLEKVSDGSVNIGAGITYNNYSGIDINTSVAVSFTNGMVNPSIGYTSNGGLSLGASPNLAAISKKVFGEVSTGKTKFGKLTSLLPTDGELSWSSSQGLGMSVQRGSKRFKETKKKKKVISSAKYSANILTNEKVYSPGSDVSMWNFGVRANVAVGTDIFGIDGQGQADFFYNIQRLGGFGKTGDVQEDVATWNLNAYGVDYAENASTDLNTDLLDFNREHEYPLREESPLLPASQLTYDVFSISGQGAGGTFRNYRNDYPVVGKNSVSDAPNTQLNVGIEVSSGNLFKVAGNGSLVFTTSQNGYWKNGTGDLTSEMGFASRDENDWLYEPSYFKKGGEFGLTDEQYLLEIGGESALGFNLINTSTVENQLTRYDALYGDVKNSDYQQNRDLERVKRASAILALTKAEAYRAGFPMGYGVQEGSPEFNRQVVPNHTGPYNFDANASSKPNNGVGYAEIERLSRLYGRPGENHHYGEFQITQNDGFTYVYGLPIYNNQTVEASFAIEAPESTDPNAQANMGYVSYNEKDPTKDNENGKDNFVSRKEIPAYAHSFLLTSILSPDYIDVTGDGVTDDDIGEAVVFNYHKVHDEYGWRNPINGSEHKARYIEGLRTEGHDDKASFVYGTKEIWVLQSIESKNMVAQFITSDREDQIGVAGESGVLAADKKQRKLDRIELYNKIDRIKESADHDPVPFKTIYFDYKDDLGREYTLCQGVPNNGSSTSGNQGKLTLRKISFAYGNSGAAMLNPYAFEYNETYADGGYDYNPLNVDRWGNYMGYNNEHPNHEFPYTNQDRTKTDDYASAWLLNKITLPSDGVINIEYESDDYAYVMEKKAMAMQPIAGVGETTDFTPGNKLFEPVGAERNFVYFELPDATYTDADVKEKMHPGTSLYFKCLFHVKDIGEPNSDDKEYVSGYAKVKDVGLCTNHSAGEPGKTYGYIELEDKKEGNLKYQPMAVAAWKFMLQGLSERVNDLPTPSGDLKEDGKDFILSQIGKLSQILKGQMGKMKTERYGQYIDLSKSIIRLQEPTGFKLGGGSRVKQVSMSDNWDNMTGGAESSAEYGSVYSYTTNDGDMSSGVAAYEPMAGNEENPYKSPIYFKYRPKSIMGLAKVGKEIEDYVDGPYGEMFFPSASVGYSKVTVRSLASQRVKDGQLTASPTGYTVSEFYTAKDFPVVQDKTNPQAVPTNPLGNAVGKVFGGMTKKDLAMSQGYSFILNDMHGKPERTTSYNQKDVLVNQQEFVYKTAQNPKRLNNEVDVLLTDGTIQEGKIGVEVDFVADAHQSLNRSFQTRGQPGVDAFSLGVPPIIGIPNFWAEFSSSTNNLRYISNTKVIYQYGILDKVIARDESSVVTTENRLWDAESGQVLLTRTYNEYEDPIESLNLPAHFAYGGMEGAYKNLDVVLKNIAINNGVFDLPTGKEAEDYFEPGDEMITIDHRLTYKKAWVLEVDEVNDRVFIIDRMGKAIDIDLCLALRVLRSGKRNQTSASVLNVTSNGDIITQLQNQNIDQVLQVSSTEFSDQWGTYCDRLPEEVCQLSDDLIDVLNCMTDKGMMLSASLDNGINLDKDCSGIEWESDLKQQALDLSDMTIIDHEYTDRVEYKNILKVTGDEIDAFKYEAALVDNGFLIEKSVTERNAITKAFESVIYYTWYIHGDKASTELDDHAEFQHYAGTLNCNVIITHGPRPFDVRLSTSSTSKKYHMPFFKVVEPFNGKDLIAFAVGALGTYFEDDELNYPNIIPNETACEFQLVIKDPTLNFDRSEIESFSSISVDANGDYTIVATLNQAGQLSSGVSSVEYELQNNCLNLEYCTNSLECGPDIDDKTVNPYVLGMRGSWRPKNSYVYHAERFSSLASLGHTDIQVDGAYENFNLPIFNNSGGAPFVISGDRWISPATITEYTPDGSEIETQDALGNFSSEVFGYDRRVVIATANNAEHHNIAFDGFEEYAYPYYTECRKGMHWAMTDYNGTASQEAKELSLATGYYYDDEGDFTAAISMDEAHSGHYSLKIDQGGSFTTEDFVKNSCTPKTQGSMQPFKLSDCDCIGAFEPDADAEYFFSAWVKEDHLVAPKSYDDSHLKISIEDLNAVVMSTTILEPTGPVIDGWQKVTGSFVIPNNVDLKLKVEFFADPSSSFNYAYLDDVRIQPLSSQMKSFVYDHSTLRLMAELDENNYATYYEYDAEGQLLRIKKETEQGVMTLQESRNGIAK